MTHEVMPLILAGVLTPFAVWMGWTAIRCSYATPDTEETET